MLRRTSFLFCALVAVAGCAKAVPPAHEPPPPPPPPASDATPPAPPPVDPPLADEPPAAPARLAVDAPDGCMSIPRSRLTDGVEAVFICPAAKALVRVSTRDSDKSASADLKEFTDKLVASQKVKVGKTVVSKGGMMATASFTGDRVGYATVRHFGRLSVLILGVWSKEDAKSAKPIYDAVVKNVKLP